MFFGEGYLPEKASLSPEPMFHKFPFPHFRQEPPGAIARKTVSFVEKSTTETVKPQEEATCFYLKNYKFRYISLSFAIFRQEQLYKTMKYRFVF